MRSHTSRFRSRAAILVLFFLCPTGWAQAQALPTDFQQHRDRAKKDFVDGNYVEALQELEAARTINPVPRLLYNIGQCHRALGHGPEALQFFESYLKLETPPRKIRSDLEEYMAQVRANLPAPVDSDNQVPGNSDAGNVQVAAPPAPIDPNKREPGVSGQGPTSRPVSVEIKSVPPSPPKAHWSLYKQWWFWGIVTVVAAGTAAGIAEAALHQGPAFPDGTPSTRISF